MEKWKTHNGHYFNGHQIPLKFPHILSDSHVFNIV